MGDARGNTWFGLFDEVGMVNLLKGLSESRGATLFGESKSRGTWHRIRVVARLVTIGRWTQMLLRWNPTRSCGSTNVGPSQNQNGTQGFSSGNMVIDCATSLITTLNWVGLYNCSWMVLYAMAGGCWASLMRSPMPFGRVSSVSTCLRRSSYSRV